MVVIVILIIVSALLSLAPAHVPVCPGARAHRHVFVVWFPADGLLLFIHAYKQKKAVRRTINRKRACVPGHACPPAHTPSSTHAASHCRTHACTLARFHARLHACPPHTCVPAHAHSELHK